MVEHVVVIVAADRPELVDTPPDSGRFAKVEGSASHRQNAPRGDLVGVRLGVVAGVEREDVPEHGAATGQVEVGVVGQVDRRRLVRSRFVFND